MTKDGRGFRRVRVEGDRAEEGEDLVAVEEPLQIRVDEEPVAVLMRTPGNDHELALGFLLAEGWIDSATDVLEVTRCADVPEEERENVIKARLLARPGARPEPRTLAAASGCGVCGRATIEDMLARCGRIGARPALDRDRLAGLAARFASEQRLFADTGGVHGAALFHHEDGVTPRVPAPVRPPGARDAPDAGDRRGGGLLVLREDVGRHNAIDKVVGWTLVRGQATAGTVMLVSSRAGFEVVQKAARGGIPAVVCMGAATSLAIELARAVGIFLAGFYRDGRFTVYAYPDALV